LRKLSDYILITKFYNEQELLPLLIKNIASQTHRPKLFIFIDDGSIDESVSVLTNEASKYRIPFELVSMPKKQKGNLDTLGRAWNKAQPLIKEVAKTIPYVAMVDVDTQFPQDYFEKMIAYMDKNPQVGVVAGQVLGEVQRNFPMFTGKVVRSEIIRSINKYWGISVDSFINVKALLQGYELQIFDDMKVKSRESFLLTPGGRFRAGRLAYYSGTDTLYVITKGVLKFDAQYLRGYWSEWSRRVWQCEDEDILNYYHNEFKRKLIGFIRKTLRL
jgi:glycosyltransferase involved in cell wall biosynthesis